MDVLLRFELLKKENNKKLPGIVIDHLFAFGQANIADSVVKVYASLDSEAIIVVFVCYFSRICII